MIKRLRSRFIRIATLSVAAVMLLLTVILNVVNYVSTDSDLRSTLTLIYENQGTIPVSDQGGSLPDTGDVPPPEPPQGGPNERDGRRSWTPAPTVRSGRAAPRWAASPPIRRRCWTA